MELEQRMFREGQWVVSVRQTSLPTKKGPILNTAVVEVQAAENLNCHEEDAPEYLIEGWGCSGDNTTDFNEAELAVKGFVKWDGCSNLTLGDQGYFHFCSLRDAEQLADLMRLVYRGALEMLTEMCDPHGMVETSEFRPTKELPE